MATEFRAREVNHLATVDKIAGAGIVIERIVLTAIPTLRAIKVDIMEVATIGPSAPAAK